MNIGFDARMIDHPGIGSYIRCLLPEMFRLSPEDKFILFGNAEKLSYYSSKKNVKIIGWNAPVYSIKEQLSSPIDKEDIDLLHSPHFNVPIFTKKKLVVTIHDLIYLLVPESVKNPMAKIYAKFMIANALKKADRIISVSKNTRKDIFEIFGKKYDEKIETIHEAADPAYRKLEDAEGFQIIRKKYNLPDRFILYVGSIKPHKNVSGLIEVYQKLKSWGAPHGLVLVGRFDKKEKKVKKKIDSIDGVRYLGEVSKRDLVYIYNLADILVHLSFYEGFGLTILEAMRCGTPVVASETSSITEIAGNAALKVSPRNISEIADTVFNVLINPDLRNGLIEEGYRHSKKFSWEKTARQTLSVYHNI